MVVVKEVLRRTDREMEGFFCLIMVSSRFWYRKMPYSWLDDFWISVVRYDASIATAKKNTHYMNI